MNNDGPGAASKPAERGEATQQFARLAEGSYHDYREPEITDKHRRWVENMAEGGYVLKGCEKFLTERLATNFPDQSAELSKTRALLDLDGSLMKQKDEEYSKLTEQLAALQAQIDDYGTWPRDHWHNGNDVKQIVDQSKQLAAQQRRIAELEAWIRGAGFETTCIHLASQPAPAAANPNQKEI